MPIAVTCSCGKPIKAPDAAAGKRVRCPHCQQIVEVPGAAIGGAAGGGLKSVPAQAKTAPRKPAAGAAGAAGAATNLVWLGVGAALSVGVLAAVVWFAARSLDSGGVARADLAGSKEKPAPPPDTPAPGSEPTAPDSGPSTGPSNEEGSPDQEPPPRRARNRGNGPRGMPPGAMPPGIPGGPGGPFGGPGGPFGGPGGPPAPPREPKQPPDPSLPSYDGHWEGTATVSKEPDRPGGPPLSVSLTIANNIVRAINIRPAEGAFPGFIPPLTELVEGPASLTKDAAGRASFVVDAGPGGGFAPPGAPVPRIVVTGSFVDSTTAKGKFHFEHPADPRMRQQMPEFAWTLTRPAPNAPAAAPTNRPDPPVEPGVPEAVGAKDDPLPANDTDRRKGAAPRGLEPNGPVGPLPDSVNELLAAIDDTADFDPANGKIDKVGAVMAILSSQVPKAARKVRDENLAEKAIGPVLAKWRETKRGGGKVALIHFHAIQAFDELGDVALSVLPELEEALKDKGYKGKDLLKKTVESLRKLDKANKIREKTQARKEEIGLNNKEAAGVDAKAADEENAETENGDTKENQAAAKLKNVRQFLEKNDQVQARKYAKQILERFPETSAAKEAREILDELGDE